MISKWIPLEKWWDWIDFFVYMSVLSLYVLINWAVNSAGECHPHTVEVAGSNPVPPTILKSLEKQTPGDPRLLYFGLRNGGQKGDKKMCMGIDKLIFIPPTLPHPISPSKPPNS